MAAGQGDGSLVLDSVITTPKELENSDGTMELKMAQGTVVNLVNIRIFDRPTMVDYLRSGWQVSLVCAVDYTASNKPPTQPDSLHYMGGNNQYQNALISVGQIVEPYDSDR